MKKIYKVIPVMKKNRYGEMVKKGVFFYDLDYDCEYPDQGIERAINGEIKRIREGNLVADPGALISVSCTFMTDPEGAAVLALSLTGDERLNYTGRVCGVRYSDLFDLDARQVAAGKIMDHILANRERTTERDWSEAARRDENVACLITNLTKLLPFRDHVDVSHIRVMVADLMSKMETAERFREVVDQLNGQDEVLRVRFDEVAKGSGFLTITE